MEIILCTNHVAGPEGLSNDTDNVILDETPLHWTVGLQNIFGYSKNENLGSHQFSSAVGAHLIQAAR